MASSCAGSGRSAGWRLAPTARRALRGDPVLATGQKRADGDRIVARPLEPAPQPAIRRRRGATARSLGRLKRPRTTRADREGFG